MLWDKVLALAGSEVIAGLRREIDFPDISIDQAVVFDIDNVAEYVFGLEEYDLHRSFPNLAPAYPLMVMEYAVPEKQEWLFGFRHKAAVLLQSDKRDDGWFIYAFPIFEDARRRATLTKYVIRFDIDGCGRFAEWSYDIAESAREHDVPELADALVGMVIAPCLMALCFLHCKNVEMTANEPPPLPMTKKRKQHPPRTKYYTLDIKPMQRILETEGNASKTGLKMALHICRGHFKDYSNGPGLFGRYRGMYWWDSQVRGDRKYGEVVKDYHVNAPSGAPETRP